MKSSIVFTVYVVQMYKFAIWMPLTPGKNCTIVALFAESFGLFNVSSDNTVTNNEGGE